VAVSGVSLRSAMLAGSPSKWVLRQLPHVSLTCYAA
jgi:hypothetical protein